MYTVEQYESAAVARAAGQTSNSIRASQALMWPLLPPMSDHAIRTAERRDSDGRGAGVRKRRVDDGTLQQAEMAAVIAALGQNCSARTPATSRCRTASARPAAATCRRRPSTTSFARWA